MEPAKGHHVRLYENKDKDAVIDVVLSIQNGEFGLGISIEEQPDILDIPGSYTTGGGGFWVAVSANEEVIGTVGLMRKSPAVAVMKKFFVRAPWRGKQHGVATELYEAMIQFARTQGLAHIILDTPSIATRSHAFYQSVGFRRIAAQELPVEYTYPDRDSILMMLSI
jgi:RimJ/RimL family protein N-acetyltransferase